MRDLEPCSHRTKKHRIRGWCVRRRSEKQRECARGANVDHRPCRARLPRHCNCCCDLLLVEAARTLRLAPFSRCQAFMRLGTLHPSQPSFPCPVLPCIVAWWPLLRFVGLPLAERRSLLDTLAVFTSRACRQHRRTTSTRRIAGPVGVADRARHAVAMARARHPSARWRSAIPVSRRGPWLVAIPRRRPAPVCNIVLEPLGLRRRATGQAVAARASRLG